MSPSPAHRAGAARASAGREVEVRSTRTFGRERQTHRERVAVGVFDEAVAPTVWRPVLRRREHRVTSGARAALGFVRVDAEESNLNAKTALLCRGEPRAPRLTRI